ncbi:SusC/RagA family TonB-linked outer membrane protein [Chitinophaga arvensicola]|uniref:TonB-linked outer membrane protein, SusC/RagA family n=1 Tax=Chitinophaga arvensicola TaxID=29529 RepID=A0A1I0R8Z2_9BACT|nr:SusC/RagA family TonB-linked outer membrane protein [Chitinophaga arvensicola]SEW36630.1 TonB-linked outer membrane protein, SusC/RagA family [Chitinophaga arvensicola]
MNLFLPFNRPGILLLLAGILGTQTGNCQQAPGDTSYRRTVWKNTAFFSAAGDTLSYKTVRELPYLYTGQLLEGRVPGVTLLRNSGEPGVSPLTLIRGISNPIGGYRDVYSNQPLYVVNGMPLVNNNNPYARAIKESDFTDIGSGIDVNALIDMDNVQQIHVLKGPEAVALYGARAANGAILITTTDPEPGKYHISFNAYGGVAVKPSVKTANGDYQRKFLLPFYNEYATPAQWRSFPAYLADSTKSVYYGPANWDDLYYRNAVQHGVGLSIAGGSNRANFRFGVGERTENGVADQTALKRYNVFYDMTVIPVERLYVNTYVQALTSRRNRNRSLLERLAEEEYYTNQQYPLSPNKAWLGQYYTLLDNGTDRNLGNAIQAAIDVRYDLMKTLSIHTQASIDYNDNNRDLFVPASLNDANSYNAYFTGVNRRIRWNNYLSYDRGHLHAQAGQTLEEDQLKYDYIRAYRGPSDFIKIPEVQTDSSFWLTHDKTLTYAYKDYLKQRTLSFYGNVSYDWQHKYTATVSLRSDGSSMFGNGYWWAVSPVASFSWNMKQENWLRNAAALDALELQISAGRTARMPATDMYGYGPYYTVGIGWTGASKISTYGSMPTLGMPYDNGYTGGGVKWPYDEHLDLGLRMQAFHWLSANVNIYSRTSRDLMIQVPVDPAYGFKGKVLNGMDVRNSGIELSLQGNFRLSQWRWSSSIVMQYNRNKLLQLPGGLTTMDYGQRHLETGKPVDQFWLLENEGIYKNDNEIPVSDKGKVLTYNGLALHAGDPRWKDQNGDYVIDEKDRVMQGHTTPPLRGGWNNTLQYKKWSLDASFSFAVGNYLLNSAVANRFDFANREGAEGLAGIKEITFWQQVPGAGKYPHYNPWSLVKPYQAEQTLFYEKASWLKLQSLTLRRDLAGGSFIKHTGLRKLQAYVTALNVFTLSPYTAGDPSLADYFGYSSGYAQPLPRTFTIGITADF